MEPEEIAGMTVQTVMDRWPGTVAVFIAHRMACPGCHLSPFMTVREAAHQYRIDLDTFVGKLICSAADE